MQRKTLTSAILGALFVALLPATAAQAQATRTWVSGVGDDANPCSRTAPCKTFAGAISKTAGGGEINVLDPGGFGAVTITKSITISSTFEAGVLVSGTNGIIISAGVADTVVLEGLDIEGIKTGLDGVKFLAGALLVIERCKIHQFAQNGVNAASSTPGARTVINKSLILSNGTLNSNPLTGGVNIASGNVVNINDTVIQNNQNFGVQANAGGTAALLRSVTTPTGITGAGSLVSIGPSNFFATGTPNQPLINFQ